VSSSAALVNSFSPGR